MYEPFVKCVEETNRDRIMKGENTKSLGKIVWNYTVRPIKWWFNSDLGAIITGILVIVLVIGGFIKFVQYEDEKNYPYGEYEMTYRVYYSENNVKEYTITHNRPIYVTSHKGSNEVHKHDFGNVIETSAPIEVVRYVNKAK
jgi:hypothetical protein